MIFHHTTNEGIVMDLIVSFEPEHLHMLHRMLNKRDMLTTQKDKDRIMNDFVVF